MTKAKAKSPYHKDTMISTTLVDELLQRCPPLPTQEDLFGPDGVIKQLSKALIERCLEAETWATKNTSVEPKRRLM
ncbi:MAG TPA: hypothetical protein VFV38_32865 [Ktedonobacteraceae bacterium]|nr:hypothetical protein [Ktedonobacteraceae bacterium]